MKTGTVTSWNDVKGFGFIRPDGESKDVFVHYSAIAGHGRRSLAVGARVSFETEITARGVQATHVARKP